METYEIELEEARAKSAAIVFKKYLTRPDTSDSGVDTCENEVLKSDRMNLTLIYNNEIFAFLKI